MSMNVHPYVFNLWSSLDFVLVYMCPLETTSVLWKLILGAGRLTILLQQSLTTYSSPPRFGTT